MTSLPLRRWVLKPAWSAPSSTPYEKEPISSRVALLVPSTRDGLPSSALGFTPMSIEGAPGPKTRNPGSLVEKRKKNENAPLAPMSVV